MGGRIRRLRMAAPHRWVARRSCVLRAPSVIRTCRNTRFRRSCRTAIHGRFFGSGMVTGNGTDALEAKLKIRIALHRYSHRVITMAFLVSFSATIAVASPPAQTAPERLRSFFAAEWEYQLRESPEYATYVGDGRYNDRLSDQSPAAQAREAAHTRSQLQKLRAMPETGLSEQDRVSRQMMLQQMQSSLESFDLKEWEMPISQINGIHLDLASMYAQMPFRTTKDYENYLARLHAIPTALDQTIAVMQLGMRDRMMQ